MTIRVKYEWRELTEDGLLKLPEEVGTFYESEELNCSECGDWAFNSEEEAVARFTHLQNKYRGSLREKYTLIKLYVKYEAV